MIETILEIIVIVLIVAFFILNGREGIDRRERPPDNW